MSQREFSTRENVAEGTVLWEPSAQRISRSGLKSFDRWLAEHRGLAFGSYDEIWTWSVEHLEEFWSALWDFFALGRGSQHGPVLERGNGAEGARWFPAARLNYVDQVMRQDPGDTALVVCTEDEDEAPREMTYGELFGLAGSLATGLRGLGVGEGDRVVAVLPNGAPAVIAFLATASLGALWSSCAPEFGAPSMVDRFVQVQPKVLVAATSYRYGGKVHDMEEKIATLESRLEGLVATISVGGTLERPGRAGVARLDWEQMLSASGKLEPRRVGFSHPLWILYSSGTTGLPKAIVHGHGGILVEHLKALVLHSDLRGGERFFWFTTTGWMMWNFLVGGLLVGATVVCYDGDPNWPDPARLWRLARDVGITYFGTSAPYLENCRRMGVSPRDVGDMAVHSIGSTGAPLSPEGFAWAASEVADDVLVGSVSGGTDVCTAFLASCPWLAVRAGELQCRALGAKVEAYSEDGRPVVDVVGELVVTEPMPSMPTMFWGDDGTRLHESYFERFPGVWRHGDWVKITSRGSAVVYGRSDATLNRGGVRMGTAEFYRVVEGLPEVTDSLVVDTSELGRQGELILFVVLRSGAELSDEVESSIRDCLRRSLSPRHVPNRIISVGALPRTINGKKLEVPLRRILLGADRAQAVAPGALADPSALDSLLERVEENTK